MVSSFGCVTETPSGQRWKLLRVVEHVAEQVTAVGEAGQDRADREAVRPQDGSSNSSHSIGAETGAPAAGRGLYGAPSVLLIAF